MQRLLTIWLGCLVAATAGAAPPLPSGARLRSLCPTGFSMGAAIAYDALTDADYATVLGREYNLGMPENATKMDAVEPANGTFDFSQGDAIVSFAQAHGMKMQAGPLVWASQVPSWVTGGGFTSAQLSTIMTTYINTVMQHYRSTFPGVVVAWEVVNENTTTGAGTWGAIPNYVQLAFQTARQADPNVALFYNDYGWEQGGGGADAVYNLVSPLKAAGLIDGVGMQCHFGSPVSGSAIAATMQRFTTLGLQVYVTELDYRIASSDGLTPNNPADLTVQAQNYQATLTACVSTPGCTQFLTWGFTDAHSWIPSFFAGQGAALPFDAGYEAKPAYYAMQTVLAGLPHPDAGSPTDGGSAGGDAGESTPDGGSTGTDAGQRVPDAGTAVDGGGSGSNVCGGCHCQGAGAGPALCAFALWAMLAWRGRRRRQR
jgi:endo-1,4-beta-xylanase